MPGREEPRSHRESVVGRGEARVRSRVGRRRDTTIAVPDQLIQLESEKELVSGGFRSGWVLQEDPHNRTARAALNVLMGLDPKVCARREHVVILQAMQSVYEVTGSLTLGLVLAELRKQKQSVWVFRALESAYDYGTAPVLSMAATAETVMRAAEGRKTFRQNLEMAARIAEGEVP